MWKLFSILFLVKYFITHTYELKFYIIVLDEFHYIVVYLILQSQPELMLTYLGARFGDEDTAVENEETENLPPKGHKFFIAVCERLEGRGVKAQKWERLKT